MSALLLKVARLAADLPQKGVANISGVPRWKIALFESGKASLTREDQEKIVEAMTPLIGAKIAHAIFPGLALNQRPESALRLGRNPS